MLLISLSLFLSLSPYALIEKEEAMQGLLYVGN